MVAELSRRQLFGRNSLTVDPSIIRPPGASPERFEQLCSQCDLCIKACPEAILQIDDAGHARVDFARGACTSCGTCAEICPTGALSPARTAHWPWRAAIGPSCLSVNGVSCRLCEDACEAGTIRFRLKTGGQAEPQLDRDICTGCGACVAVCPVAAVSLDQDQVQKPEAVA